MKLKVEFLNEEVEHKQITSKRTGEVLTMHEQKVAVFDPDEPYPVAGKVTLPKSRDGKAFPKGQYLVPLELKRDNFGGLEAMFIWAQAQPVKLASALPEKKAA